MREAYRVLKPGSKAVFTVWGRRERSVFFTIPHQAKVNMGILDSEVQCDGFRIGENIEATVKDLEEIGFS
jgi:SAM-dependent methyltransferase